MNSATIGIPNRSQQDHFHTGKDFSSNERRDTLLKQLSALRKNTDVGTLTGTWLRIYLSVNASVY